MYFRKYFEGTELYYNSYANRYIHGTNTTKKDYTYLTKIICEAIKETVLAAGIDFNCEGNEYILQFEGVPVQFVSPSNVGAVTAFTKGNANAFMTVGTSYGICSGGSYKFYVSLLGDPKSILFIMIGAYSNPAQLAYGIMIANIIDLRDGSRKKGIAQASSAGIYIFNESGEVFDEMNLLQFKGLQYTNLIKNGSLIPLVDSIDTTGFFKIEQCYMGNAGLSGSYNFYNIGGDIFMQPGSNFTYLIKCTTEINQKGEHS